MVASGFPTRTLHVQPSTTQATDYREMSLWTTLHQIQTNSHHCMATCGKAYKPDSAGTHMLADHLADPALLLHVSGRPALSIHMYSRIRRFHSARGAARGLRWLEAAIGLSLGWCDGDKRHVRSSPVSVLPRGLLPTQDKYPIMY